MPTDKKEKRKKRKKNSESMPEDHVAAKATTGAKEKEKPKGVVYTFQCGDCQHPMMKGGKKPLPPVTYLTMDGSPREMTKRVKMLSS